MVHYAVYYSTKNSGRVKNYAGEDKVDYICHAMNAIGEDVVIISNAKTNERKFAKRESFQLFDRTKLLYFSSLPRINTLVHALDVLWGYLQLLFYVLFHVSASDTVLVYHSLGYRGLWGFLRKIKRFNYVLEVEELFQTFQASVSGYKKHERKVFRYPDAFLFSNSILEAEINIDNKPSVIINGIYNCSTGEENKVKREKKKVVYAGSLEQQKGVDYVIQAAKCLSTDYEVHIIGFGTDKDMSRVNKLLEECKGSGVKVSYDGVYKGEEYLRYLQSCNIGMCIQDENDEFNKYEYPSKVFSYLSKGLQVVANDLIQLRKSDIYPFLHISKSKNPEDVAVAIKSCSDNYIDANEIMKKLDEGFKRRIKVIIRR